MSHRAWGVVFSVLSLATLACSDALPSSEEPVDTLSEPAFFETCGNNCSSWVYPSAGSRHLLMYIPDDEGDRIPEFSHIGYNKSRKGTPSELPGGVPPMGPEFAYVGQAPVVDPAEVANICVKNKYDHGLFIQSRLGTIRNASPDATGVRGHLHLPRGHYAVWNRLRVPDRVVLAGQSENEFNGQPATTLHACGDLTDPLITVDESNIPFLPLAWTNILDEVVPVGSTSIVIGSTLGLVRGDRIVITRRSTSTSGTANWFDDLQMRDTWTNPAIEPGTCWDSQSDQVKAHMAEPKSCFPGDIEFERTVTHVEPSMKPAGFRVFFEHPLTNALEYKYGPHTVRKVISPIRANYSGVYRVQGRVHLFDIDAQKTVTACPEPPDPVPEDYEGCSESQDFIHVDGAIDSWVMDVVGQGFAQNAVAIGSAARQVTVEHARSVTPDGTDTGGLGYSFTLRGHMNLFVDCYANHGRHDFLTQNGSSGPGAFVDCDAENAMADSGTHHDWSIGTLLDRVEITSSEDGRAARITAANRHYEDTHNGTDNHGWTGANMVVWNSTAKSYEYFNPPGAQNWLIGSTGTLVTPDMTEQESVPHYDFRSDSEHGTLVSLAPLSIEPNPSLFRVSNAQWRTYLDDPQGYELETRHYFIGDPDQPAAGEIGQAENPPDTVNDDPYVNTNFRTYVQNTFGGGLAGFDNPVGNHNVPFTVRYELEPGESVIGAYLAARIERGGSWGSDAHHHVTFASRDYANQHKTLYWRCSSATPQPCNPILPSMTGPEGWSISTLDPSVRVLDLSSEPYLTYLGNTQNGVGELNINFFKKTRVDWAALTLIIRRD